MTETYAQVTSTGTTMQGTGHLLGVQQHFIRFAGCSVKNCPIRRDCDEQFSLNKQNGSRHLVSDLIQETLAAVGPGGWMHITGGEPTDQASELEELVKSAYRAKLKVHIQTSGTAPVEMPYDWLTVSPKVPAKQLEQRYGNEVVVVYEGQTAEELEAYTEGTSFWYYYLQPKWENRDGGVGAAVNGTETAEMINELRRRGGDGPRHHNGQEWNMTIQAHKYWGIA